MNENVLMPSALREAKFLCDRLAEFERELLDDEVGTEFFGHVAPSAARLRVVLEKSVPTPAADEVETLPPLPKPAILHSDHGFTAFSGWQMEAYARAAIAALQARSAEHADDIAVDQFAAAMKAKLAQKRGEGRGGWQNRDECSAERLSSMLRDHVGKGDPVDVANFAMMLHQRGESLVPAELAGGEPVAWPPIETMPMWALGIVTDGEHAAITQKAETDHGGHYFAVDPEDGLSWDPTHWMPFSTAQDQGDGHE